MTLHHLFIPHPKTHKKSPLLHWKSLLVYILLFLILQVSFRTLSLYKPGVLGINSDITIEKVVEETNKERQKAGLEPLVFNESLSSAAFEKAQNMFEDNYWAHFSPAGRTPWQFINKTGYKFSYAGENLARNFYNSEDVVKAWMNSSSHRDNILSKNYSEIGIGVVDGVLLGQKTTLVVQLFGKPSQPLARLPGHQPINTPSSSASNNQGNPSVFTASVQPAAGGFTLDPYQVTKTLSLTLFTVIGSLIIIDFIVLKRRGVFRLSSHHIAHLCFLGVTWTSVITTNPGMIL